MDFLEPSVNLATIAPVAIVGVWAALMLLVDLQAKNKKTVGWLSAVGLGAALVYAISQWNSGDQVGKMIGTFTPVNGAPMIVLDNYATYLNIIYLITGILAIFIALNYLDTAKIERGEYYPLMLFSIVGMMLMGMGNDLVIIFLALELLSIPLYVLSGFAHPKIESEESALKYFLLGAFSSGFLVFGIALVYGATGSTNLTEILAGVAMSSTLLRAGVAFLIVGFAFKVGAAPFHMWTPDVYQGAPTSVTAFMSVGAKVGGFAALIRVLLHALPTMGEAWVPAIAVISALTLIVGNFIAIRQDDIKRMLAYSSIAHAGYILMGVAASYANPDGVSAALFYMMAYMFTNMGVFAIVVALEYSGNSSNLKDYAGLWKRAPMLALIMLFFMLSLTGIPPTGGFSGKFFIFRETMAVPGLVWLAVVGVATSVVSAFYYLRVVYTMFMYDGSDKVMSRPALNVTLAVAVIATLVFGFFPAPWFQMARDAALRVAGG